MPPPSETSSSSPLIDFFVACAAGPSRSRWKPPLRPTPDMMEKVAVWRHRCRQDDSGGGMCHMVTELCENEYGWARVNVTYLAPDDEVAVSGHIVNILPDGAIYDPTADQFGEGHDQRILETDDSEYRRYRPEWCLDFNPSTDPKAAAIAADYDQEWTGELDRERDDRLDAERGQDWWLPDDSGEHLRRYPSAQKIYGSGDAFWIEFIEKRWADMEKRVARARESIPNQSPAP